MNGAKAFFDTNVLLYMYGGDADKRARAKELFRQYALSGRMLLSTQVVQEFYAAGSRKLGMPRRELRDATAALLDSPLIVVGPSQITVAIQNEETLPDLLLGRPDSGCRGIRRRRGLVHGGLEPWTTVWNGPGA